MGEAAAGCQGLSGGGVLRWVSVHTGSMATAAAGCAEAGGSSGCDRVGGLWGRVGWGCTPSLKRNFNRSSMKGWEARTGKSGDGAVRSAEWEQLQRPASLPA